MPTHGRTGFKHVFLGSTAERIVQHSPCPVFVVRQQNRKPRNGATRATKLILVPIDFSRCSLAGLKYAMRFAQQMGAKIIVLHAVAYRYTSNGWITYELTDATKAAEEEARQQMKTFVAAAKLDCVPFETEVVHGNAVEKICDYAQEHDVDLIITSTHGRTGLKHVVMGSVAENVVRRSACSVLAVPSFLRQGAAVRLPRTNLEPRRPHTRRSLQPETLSRKYRKLTRHAFPERRKTNRFRETHLVQ
jgi:nucleotide-binding universal stress UspA family protein